MHRLVQLAAVVASALVVGPAVSLSGGPGLVRAAAAAADSGVVRVAGPDRFATAAALSARTFESGVPVVYVATGEAFADALAGGPAAAVSGGPVLLVARDRVPAATAAELQRLRPASIVVLGGGQAVAASVEAELAGFASAGVTRLAGRDRFATAAAVSRAVFDPGVGTVFVATGADYPDALAGGALAGKAGAPVLLVGATAVTAATETELARLRPDTIVVLGGTGVIGTQVTSRLQTLTDATVTRAAGPDRFGTAAAVANRFGDNPTTVYVATGQDYPDALAGVAAAVQDQAPILLVTRDAVPQATAAVLRTLQPDTIVILGGTAAISTTTQQTLVDIVTGEEGGGGLPAGWPAHVELGMSSSPGTAAEVAEVVSGFRYQYLAGGVNTGGGWASWNPDGTFVTAYVNESRPHGLIPVFTYYMLYQSSPGSSLGEAEGIRTNLTTRSTMASYYEDLRLFFRRAAETNGPVVLHVEPDLWAFMQQQSAADDASTVPVEVDGSGMSDVAGLPDNAAGFAQAIVRLRDRYAPNVTLGYHFSAWGTGNDFLLSDPTDNEVQALARRTAAFYRSTGASFDVAFTDLADRDAAFKQYVYGDGGASWLDAGDYRRSAVYIGTFGGETGLRTVLWQLPYGNTKMRAMNNTWNHYQDNKVETILGQPDRAQLRAYTDAGVVAYLFGPGAGGTTCACDWAGDGVTNPAPINGNTRESLNADDDGGYFGERARLYYQEGPVPLT
jgi:putative cell wall-binding protein